MTKKQLLSISLATAMVCSSLAGCSKGKVRKIEGADDDTCKFIGVLEEVYDMKGYQTELVMDISSKADADGEAVNVSGTITEKSLVDSDGNMSSAIIVKCDYDKYHIDSKVAEISFIENNIYVDLSGTMNVVKDLAGEVVVNETLSYMNMTADDLAAVLCFSIPTGEIKASDFKIANFQKITQAITDDYAVAISEAKALTVDKDTYTLEMNADVAKKLAESFVTSFDKNGSSIYDGVIEFVEGYKTEEKVASAAKAILEQVNAGIVAVGGEDQSDSFEIDKLKEEIADSIKKAKDNKDENLKKLMDELKDGLKEAEGEDTNAKVKAIFTDEKDGYSVKFEADASASVEEVSADVKANATMKVTSTSDKVQKPVNSVELSKTTEKVFNLVNMVMSSFMGGGSYDDYVFEYDDTEWEY